MAKIGFMTWSGFVYSVNQLIADDLPIQIQRARADAKKSHYFRMHILHEICGTMG